jgi:hypothetical protein
MTHPARALPGIRFDVAPPVLGDVLPRMDIALFVGFAAAGPVGLPVAVESLVEFEAVFGEPVLLALDATTAAPVHSLLHPGVRGFFSNGGRRCWVVRVAGASAHTRVFPLANLLLARRAEPAAAWAFGPGSLAARSPGAWADGLGVATALRIHPVRVRPEGKAADPGLAFVLLGPPALLLRQGALLRWREPGGGLVHARIAHAEAPLTGLDGRVSRRVQLAETITVQARAPSAADTSAEVTVFEPDERRMAAVGGWQTSGRYLVSARWPAPCVPGNGAVLRVQFAHGAAWFTVAASTITQTGAADGLVSAELSGRLWDVGGHTGHDTLAAWIGDGSERLVQWLELDLRVRGGDGTDFSLDALGMAAPLDADAPGLAFTTLPDDTQWFGGEAGAAALAQRDGAGRLLGRFPLASLPSEGEVLLLPLGDEALAGNGLSPAATERPALERDGLDTFTWELFAEPLLAQSRSDTLADQAEALRLFGSRASTLRGMHAAFGAPGTAVAEEPTLLAIPDAVHSGWVPAADGLPAWTEQAPPAADATADAATACTCDFTGCLLTPLAAPRFVRGADPDADGNFTLQWSAPEAGANYGLEEAGDAAFATAVQVYAGMAQRWAVLGKKPGSQYYRVRAISGVRTSPWSAAVEVRVGLNGYQTRAWQPADLLAIHRLMLRLAAGRGDMLAVLALPRHYRFEDAVAHAGALRDAPLAGGAGVLPAPIGSDETRALSHGALYHPWLLTRRVDTPLESPPDGAACGQLAAGALERGAWAAVANRPLRDVVALGGIASLQDMQNLLDAQVNLVRSSPQGFVFAGADTLTPDADWRPINVRRLMSLLRRLALRRGATYVFEPNGATLRRTVERGFEAVMHELFRRGAFAGSQAAAAYRVEVGDDINTPQRHDLGQFWVELKVAPALPLRFLTVRLARSGERLVASEAR